MTAEYLAGFFDGEGSVGVHLSSGSKLPSVHLSLYQKDPKVLYLIQEFLGMGVIRKNSSCSVLVITHRDRVRRFIKIVYPHAVVKRDQLKLAYEMAVLTSKRLPNGSWSGAKYRDRRLELYKQFREIRRPR